jgi:hypothetical protein
VLRHDVVNGLPDILLIANVKHERASSAACRIDSPGYVFYLVFLDITGADNRAFSPQRGGNSLAQSLPCARNDNYLVSHILSIHARFSSW